MSVIHPWYDEVLARTAEDPWHRECLAEVARWEPKFLEIRESLSTADREVLDFYIAACEELRSSLVHSAYAVGRWHGLSSKYREQSQLSL